MFKKMQQNFYLEVIIKMLVEIKGKQKRNVMEGKMAKKTKFIQDNLISSVCKETGVRGA